MEVNSGADKKNCSGKKSYFNVYRKVVQFSAIFIRMPISSVFQHTAIEYSQNERHKNEAIKQWAIISKLLLLEINNTA